MNPKKPPCATVLPWLKANLGNKCLAALTSTDAKALAAAVQTIELYAFDSDPTNIEAFALIVRCMQPKTMHLAYQAIAHVMDWSDRSRIWKMAKLPEIRVPKALHDSSHAAGTILIVNRQPVASFTLTSCQAGQDGECFHPFCPQNRDKEPAKTGRFCPLPASGLTALRENA